MPRTSFSAEEILTLLAGAPPRLAALTADLTPAQLRTAPAAGEWSATEVLAHLRSCADVWGGCIAAILESDRPTLRAIDPRTWTRSTDYPDLEFRPSLQAYTTQREALLRQLEALSPEGWERSATVTGAGKPLVRSVLAYAQWLARHERPHIEQVDRIVKTVRMQQQAHHLPQAEEENPG